MASSEQTVLVGAKLLFDGSSKMNSSSDTFAPIGNLSIMNEFHQAGIVSAPPEDVPTFVDVKK